MSAVANEIRRSRNASTVARSSIQAQPTLFSFACHFCQETLRGLKIYDNGRKTREECEREKGGERKENAETKVASPRLTSLFKCLYCRSENSFSSFGVEFGIDRREKNPLAFPGVIVIKRKLRVFSTDLNARRSWRQINRNVSFRRGTIKDLQFPHRVLQSFLTRRFTERKKRKQKKRKEKKKRKSVVERERIPPLRNDEISIVYIY